MEKASAKEREIREQGFDKVKSLGKRRDDSIIGEAKAQAEKDARKIVAQAEARAEDSVKRLASSSDMRKRKAV
ncbi:hypothetical protein, partial [Bilophila wadsworthia]|uniref:hypothetical protein n=1 Tax=Bilophila wadsworthia TaxID=35833 RepID=UPI003AB40FC7